MFTSTFIFFHSISCSDAGSNNITSVNFIGSVISPKMLNETLFHQNKNKPKSMCWKNIQILASIGTTILIHNLLMCWSRNTITMNCLFATFGKGLPVTWGGEGGWIMYFIRSFKKYKWFSGHFFYQWWGGWVGEGISSFSKCSAFHKVIFYFN